MRRGNLSILLFIILLAVGVAYIDLPNTPGIHILGINNPLQWKLGLDLQGGVSALLVPDPSQHYDNQTLQNEMPAVRDNIEQRVTGGLGASEPSIRIVTSNGVPSISVELPGLSGNQNEAVDSLLRTGLLEFWNTGPSPATLGAAFDPTQYTQYNPGNKPQFTGKDLDPNQVYVSQDQAGRPQISFAMKGDAVAAFGTFTGKNVGNYLTVTLDKVVIESAVIQSAITRPRVITGNFTTQSAQQVVTVLKYGALPIALKPASEQTVGPTLGQDSIQKSVLAAIIGLGLVILFMLLYYRLPGLLADLARLLYAATTLAIFKLIGVVLSLAGIAGFVLSVGMAVGDHLSIVVIVQEEPWAGS